MPSQSPTIVLAEARSLTTVPSRDSHVFAEDAMTLEDAHMHAPVVDHGQRLIETELGDHRATEEQHAQLEAAVRQAHQVYATQLCWWRMVSRLPEVSSHRPPAAAMSGGASSRARTWWASLLGRSSSSRKQRKRPVACRMPVFQAAAALPLVAGAPPDPRVVEVEAEHGGHVGWRCIVHDDWLPIGERLFEDALHGDPEQGQAVVRRDDDRRGGRASLIGLPVGSPRRIRLPSLLRHHTRWPAQRAP
jgi:hypothetical protein